MSHDKKLSIAIIGASGYTGTELIRLLLAHPHAHIAALTGDSRAGKEIGEVYPHLRFKNLPRLVAIEQVDFSGIALVFCCLPHGTTQSVIANLPPHLKIIDLSADFRLADPALYAQWYGHPHHAAHLQKEAVYGLTEIARGEIASARLIANPGCYPTSALLPLLPLLRAGIIDPHGIIIDAKSGVTGAGRSVKQGNLFSEVNDGIGAYGVAAHRHAPEIEQSLSLAGNQPVTVTFTPHLVPMNRGILSTIYATLASGHSAAEARATLETAYKNEPFVHLLPEGGVPATQQVRGSNDCVIGCFADRAAGRIILISAIDNLVKGAAGQAVQNMNVIYGWPETTGLALGAIFP